MCSEIVRSSRLVVSNIITDPRSSEPINNQVIRFHRGSTVNDLALGAATVSTACQRAGRWIALFSEIASGLPDSNARPSGNWVRCILTRPRWQMWVSR
jgi:hypothetical protein